MKTLHNISTYKSRRKDLRNNSTLEEILLWQKIKNSGLGVKFRRQHSIGGYIADFYCPSKRLVIEIDGSQHSGKELKEYDKIRTNFFKALNIKVLRFTNLKVSTQTSAVIKIISEALKSSPPRGGGVS